MNMLSTWRATAKISAVGPVGEPIPEPVRGDNSAPTRLSYLHHRSDDRESTRTGRAQRAEQEEPEEKHADADLIQCSTQANPRQTRVAVWSRRSVGGGLIGRLWWESRQIGIHGEFIRAPAGAIAQPPFSQCLQTPGDPPHQVLFVRRTGCRAADFRVPVPQLFDGQFSQFGDFPVDVVGHQISFVSVVSVGETSEDTEPQLGRKIKSDRAHKRTSQSDRGLRFPACSPSPVHLREFGRICRNCAGCRCGVEVTGVLRAPATVAAERHRNPLHERQIIMAAKKTTTTKTTTRKSTSTKKAPSKSAAARKAAAQKAPAETTEKKLSAIDAATKVLGEETEPLTAKQLIERMAAKGYWKSPAGKTPASTLYAAIIREIQRQGDDSRFQKVDRGLFTLNK